MLQGCQAEVTMWVIITKRRHRQEAQACSKFRAGVLVGYLISFKTSYSVSEAHFSFSYWNIGVVPTSLGCWEHYVN